MAAYFNGNSTDISSGGIQTLFLMNPSTYVQYSDHHEKPQATNNHHVFLNSHGQPPQQQPGQSPSTTQQLVGIPFSCHGPAGYNPSLHGFSPHVHYNHYNPHVEPIQQRACETPRGAQQGLSLTLSSQQQPPPGFGLEDGTRVGSGSTGSGMTDGVPGVHSSEYLKAAQELLHEVANVDYNQINNSRRETSTKKGNDRQNVSRESSGGAGDGSVGFETAAGKSVAELTTAERQEIQMKKAKLISMLDEVEQRYRQYRQQMQMVITSFEQAAGIGSAKAYTSLALKTISKQFRCLKETIVDQIRVANKSLGQEDSSYAGRTDVSRLKLVDHQLRQQRALQRLGMIRHQTSAWRPQRGLPERAVSVLRAWLFEHFLHPYPKDSDKHMLAKQTGLTRSQVSNWFINARVRLWKPMVEEMYLEETKEQQKTGSSNKTEPNNEDSMSKSNNEKLNNHKTPSISMSAAADSTSPIGRRIVRNNSEFTPIGSSELDSITIQGSHKRTRRNDGILHPTSTDFNTEDKLGMKILDERQSRGEGYSFMANHNNFMDNFEQYPIQGIQRFGAEHFTPRFSGNNGVSLTLGLPHCENLPGTHQSLIPSQSIDLGEANEFGGMMNTSTGPRSSSSAYDRIKIQNQERFVAQLLPDFVA